MVSFFIELFEYNYSKHDGTEILQKHTYLQPSGVVNYSNLDTASPYTRTVLLILPSLV